MASIYVYILIAVVISFAQTFPFTLGLSVRRTDYFLGTALTGLLVSLVTAVALYLLSMTEILTNDWGVGLHFFHLTHFTNGSMFEQVYVSLIALTNMFFIGLTLSSVYHRFGRNGLYTLLGLVSLSGSIVWYILERYHQWGHVFLWLSLRSTPQLATGTIPLIALYSVISYLLLRKATA